MYTGDIEEQIRQKFQRLRPFADEKMRRLMAASEAMVIGYGGIAMVSRASGLSQPTIRVGMAELADPHLVVRDRVRHLGGGRKSMRTDGLVVVTPIERLRRKPLRSLSIAVGRFNNGRSVLTPVMITSQLRSQSGKKFSWTASSSD